MVTFLRVSLSSNHYAGGRTHKALQPEMISNYEDSQKVSLLSLDIHEQLRDPTAIFKEQFKDILTRNDVF